MYLAINYIVYLLFKKVEFLIENKNNVTRYARILIINTLVILRI